MVDVNARFRWDADFSPIQAQVRSLARDITMLNASFVAMDKTALRTRKDLADSFASNINASGQFKASFVDLTSATEQFGRAIEKRTLSLREYFREARKVYQQDSMGARLAERQVRMRQSQVIGMGATGPGGRRQAMVVTPLKLDTSDFNTKMQLAAEKYAIFNRLVDDGATKLINWGKNTQWAGRQLTVGLTMPLVLFGAAVSKSFRDVDKELTRFAKVYGSDLVGANSAATQKMKEQIQSLAIEYSKAYGIAAKETAALAADLAATGLEGNKLVGAVAQTTRLAVLGEVDRQEAMQTTLALQSAFQQSTKELADSINFLNAVENQTSASLQDFTLAIPKAGPVVRQLGGDIKDLAVMLTAMREGGIPAAEAANAIKSGLASMINPTKAASERLAKLGVDINGIVERNRGDLMPTLMEFSGVINQLDSFARAKVIEELFGKYQFARISALFDNLNRQGSQTAQVLQLMGASSADLAKVANQEINTLTESVSMRFTRAIEGFKAALLPIGEVLTSSIIPFIEGASKALGKMIEFFNALPDPVKNVGKLLLGLTAAAGPLIMLTGVFGNFLGYITKGVLKMNNFIRMLMGLPVSKLEILDEQTIAASRATDLLTESFDREASSLSVLNTQLEAYAANLRQAAAVNPNLFTPGSPARPGRGRPPVRRSSGGDIPGYGGGDKVPALLEPGEFVVKKEIANKNRNFLRALNSGNIQKFSNGGDVTDGDSGIGRSHIVEATVDNKKIFGGVTSLENQGYNQAIEQRPDIFPGRKQPVTFEDFASARERMHDTITQMQRDGVEVPRYLADAYDSMNQDYDRYIADGPERASQKFKETLAKRMAAATLTTLPRSVLAANTVTEIFDREYREILSILEEEDNDSNIRRKILQRAETTSYRTPRGEVFLSSRRSRAGQAKFGPSSSTLAVPLYAAESRGAPTLPTQAARDLITQKDLGVWSPGFMAGEAQVQGGTRRPGTRPVTTRPGPPTRPTSSLGPRGRIAAGFHPTTRFGPRPIVRAMPGEVYLPPTAYADNGAMINADGSVSPLQQRRGMMGSSLMNIGFAGSMLAGLTTMNGEVTAATSALSAFTTALMVAGTALEMSQMVRGRGAGAGLMGMSGLGKGMMAKGGAMKAAGAAKGGIGGFLKSGAGMGLLGAGRMLVTAGGPWGMAIAAAIAVAIGAIVQFNRILQNMKDSAKAAFAEPTQSAEYFGIELGRSAERAQEFSDIVESLGMTASKTADQIDEELIKRVGSDFESLISRIKGSKDIQAVGTDLKLAYSSMIAQGFGKDEALAIVEEIARQAEQRPIYLQIKGELQMTGSDPKKAAENIAKGAVQSIKFAQDYINKNSGQEVQNSIQSMIKDIVISPTSAPGIISAIKTLFSGEQNQFLDFANTWQETVNYFSRMIDPTKRFSIEMQSALSTATNTGLVFGSAFNTLIESYKQFPKETGPSIDAVISQLNNLDDTQRQAFSESIAKNFKDNVADPALISFYDTLNNSNENLALKAKLAEAASLGLADGLSALFVQGNLTTKAINELIQKVILLDSLNTQVDESIQNGIDAMKKQSREVSQAYDSQIKDQEKLIKNLQKSADNEQKNHDAYMKSLEDESRALDERARKIQENADKQQELIDKKIKTLQVSQEQATFDQQQRERAFGVLGALMSGDAMGYEQARLDYVQAQQDRQRELAIQGLQDRKDAIAKEAQGKLDAIDKEQRAIDDRARAAQDAHDAYMQQNADAQDAAQKRIDKIEVEKNKTLKAIQAQINLLEEYKAQGYLTQQQVNDLNAKLKTMGAKLPSGIRTTLQDISTGIFGPNGDYTKIVNGLIGEMAKALNVSEADVRSMLGSTLTGQYSGRNPVNPNTSSPAGTGPGGAPNPNNGVPFRKGSPGGVNGKVNGIGTPTSDSIVARLSRGEYVVRASSVNKIGTSTLDYINATGRIPGYAQGSPGGVGSDQQSGGFWGTGPNAMTVLSIRALQDLYGRAVSTINNTTSTTTTTSTATGFDQAALSALGVTMQKAQQLMGWIQQAGWPQHLQKIAWVIAMRESSGIPEIGPGHPSFNGEDFGLFQINKPSYGGQSWWSDAAMIDPIQNAKAAYLYASNNGTNFLPWAMRVNPDGSYTWDWSYYGGTAYDDPNLRAAVESNTQQYWNAISGVTTSSAPAAGSPSSAGQAAVTYATSQQGKPYSMNATPPSSWDCSKLTAWAWAVATGADPNRGYYDSNAKVKLTPYSHDQANQISKRVTGNGGPISGLVPGDILYFRGIDSQSGGHTSMYVGNNQVFEASSPSVGLRYADLNNSWNQQYFAWGGAPIGYAKGGLIDDPNAPIGDKPKGGKRKVFIPGFKVGGTPYFGGTPTSSSGYSSQPVYYGGTPTSSTGYRPNSGGIYNPSSSSQKTWLPSTSMPNLTTQFDKTPNDSYVAHGNNAPRTYYFGGTPTAANGYTLGGKKWSQLMSNTSINGYSQYDRASVFNQWRNLRRWEKKQLFLQALAAPAVSENQTIPTSRLNPADDRLYWYNKGPFYARNNTASQMPPFLWQDAATNNRVPRIPLPQQDFYNPNVYFGVGIPGQVRYGPDGTKYKYDGLQGWLKDSSSQSDTSVKRRASSYLLSLVSSIRNNRQTERLSLNTEQWTPGQIKMGPDGNEYWYDPYRGWQIVPVGYGNAMGGLIGFARGDYVSADRAETAAQNNTYGGSPRTQYYGGTPTASNYSSTTSYRTSPYDYTPGWDSNKYNLPRQRYGPYGSGRIPRTTKPYVIPGMGRTADLATMLSHGYSHKLGAYATTAQYQQYLLNKAGGAGTYVPGYGYVGGQTTGGKKWQALTSLMASPFGTNAKQRLTASARAMPTQDFWRTLSREQKQWFFDYATTGKLNTWSNKKIFRLMPWLPKEEPKVEPKISKGPRFGVPEKQQLALLSYPNTTTIGNANYVWDGITQQYIKLSDVDRPLGGPPNLPPSFNKPQMQNPNLAGMVPGTARTSYPWWWDIKTKVAVNNNPYNFGSWNFGNYFDPNMSWQKGFYGETKVGPDGVEYWFDPYRGWVPKPTGYNFGGLIKAKNGIHTKDSILARVSRGEYVVKSNSVNSVGVATLDYINKNGKLPGFANGGMPLAPRFNIPDSKKINPTKSTKDISTKYGDTIYNINVDVAETNASPDDIANRVMRQIKTNQNARRLRSNG